MQVHVFCFIIGLPPFGPSEEPKNLLKNILYFFFKLCEKEFVKTKQKYAATALRSFGGAKEFVGKAFGKNPFFRPRRGLFAYL